MLNRRAAMLLPLLAACTEEAPQRREFPPLRYDYLQKLRLNVATMTIADPPPPSPLDLQSPAPLGPALTQMAQDRLFAGGSSGQAEFAVQQASITQSAGGLDGALAVRLTVLTTEGTRAGFAEARVVRRSAGGRDLRAALYDITAQMMSDMNIEFEFQVKRSLRDWLQDTNAAPAPAAVQREELARPGL